MTLPARRLVLVLAMAALTLGGCRDKHEPVKPTVHAEQGKLAA